jgi:CheY-like chemotaxis protein
MNYAADIAENGKKALEFYSKNDYFAILMDLDLPDISGIDITRKIRKIESIHKKRTIIVASTSRGKEATQSCFEAGMDDFMSKPFKAELLDEILKKF